MRNFLSIPTLALAIAAPSLALAEAPEPVTETVAAPAPTAGPSAMQTWETAHKAVTALVDAKAADAELESQVDALLDYTWLTRAALGGDKKYAKRCEDRCAEFDALLTRLIRRNYLKRIGAKSKGTVMVLGEEVRNKPTGAVAKVTTQVTYIDPEGIPRTIEVDYIMHQVDGTWQVRDMLTDGLSLAKTYKHDFAKLFREGGIDLVIERLQAKLAELDALAKN